MPRLTLTALGPLVAIQLVLVVWALADLLRRPATQVRGAKWIWAVAVVAAATIGPLAYLLFGRRTA